MNKSGDMILSQTIGMLCKVAQYNLKIIFAGKFIWFLLAAFAIFGFFVFQTAWNREEANAGVIYQLLLFPGMLLIFYPTVFGIQNDEDSRILEILFGIPNYKYKVWGVRLVMIYVAVFFILVAFSYVGTILLYPVNPFEMSIQLMFPLIFFGNMAFMFSTITRSGNGTAVVVIILWILLSMLIDMLNLGHSYWNYLISPFNMPNNFIPFLWNDIILKNRLFLFIGSIVWMMIGLLNLQKREKFV